MRSYLTLILLGAFTTSFCHAQDRCGIPISMQRSGFESGEQQSVVTLPADTTPLSVTIDAPTNNFVTGVSSVLVTGSYTGPATTGVSVNDIPVMTDGTRFTSLRIPLNVGANTLAIRYATLDAAPVTINRTVTYDPNLAPVVLLTSASPADHAPVQMPFYLSTKTPAGQSSITRVQVDFNGDGSFEVDTTQPSPLSYAFELPGSYTALARVSFDDGNAVTPLVVAESTVPILIQSFARTRQTVCSVYYAMKDRLRAGNATSAANALMPTIRTRFQSLWSVLAQNGTLVTAGNNLGEITDGQLSRSTVEFEIAIPSGTPGLFRGYRVQFRKDTNGVWRIISM